MSLFKKPEKKETSKVKVLGVRTAENTGVFATYNSAVYCVLVEHIDGTRMVDECSAKEMVKYLDYIDIDK